MQYFNTLPKIVKIDERGNSILLTNLMARASLVSELMANPLMYYEYDIQDSDTPEIIAHKYYGDSYRYWIVLFANQIIDAQWQWPMNGQVFTEYLAQKYPENNPLDLHHYEKIITQFDVQTNTTTTNTIVISQQEYDDTLTGSKTYSLPTGDVVVDVQLGAVDIFTYESRLNENNRKIKILKSTFVNEIEKESIL